jgi:hypothetical protein
MMMMANCTSRSGGSGSSKCQMGDKP